VHRVARNLNRPGLVGGGVVALHCVREKKFWGGFWFGRFDSCGGGVFCGGGFVGGKYFTLKGWGRFVGLVVVVFQWTGYDIPSERVPYLNKNL